MKTIDYTLCEKKSAEVIVAELKDIVAERREHGYIGFILHIKYDFPYDKEYSDNLVREIVESKVLGEQPYITTSS